MSSWGAGRLVRDLENPLSESPRQTAPGGSGEPQDDSATRLCLWMIFGSPRTSHGILSSSPQLFIWLLLDLCVCVCLRQHDWHPALLFNEKKMSPPPPALPPQVMPVRHSPFPHASFPIFWQEGKILVVVTVAQIDFFCNFILK